MSADVTGQLPKWLKPANKIIMGAQRMGLPVGTMYVLAIPGRRSGAMRATPVSPLTIDRQQYIIAGLKKGDWARNARAAGWGELSRGRRTTRVSLEEVTERAEQVKVLRAFPEQIPHGVPFFVKLGLVNGPSPDEFEAIADRSAVFRVTPQ